jgi:hypothetical protein
MLHVAGEAGLRRHNRGLALSLEAIVLLLPFTMYCQSIRFRDISHESGVIGTSALPTDRRYITEMMAGGVALFDCDNDGKLDILTVNDSNVDRYLKGGDLMVTLYHQGKDLHFSDITLQSGLTTRGWGMGIAIGDFDNDGLPDIFVTGFGHNALYHNLGGCEFKDVTEKAGLAGGGFSVGAAWADYDRDGFLDLFVSRYIDSDVHALPQPGSKNFNYKGVSMETPRLDGETDFLYRNRGDGTFEEVSAKAGVGNLEKRLGMGVVWGDYDNDGWPDLFVTNDMGGNYLYRNKHDGTFEDMGLWSGAALGEQGESFGNMAADFADIDNKGTLDLLVTRYMHQPISLYKNLGARGFKDISRESHLEHGSDSLIRWGSGFADFDNDGWPDILVANGNFTSLTDSIPDEPRYRERLQLFQNDKDSAFSDVTELSGLNEGPPQSRRGTAFGDIDNDGNIDAVVYNVGAAPSVFLNETKNSNHRVLFRLVGTKSNKSAIGARVIVSTSKMNQMDEVRGGGSYLSCNDQRLHFGLGDEVLMKRVRILWPSGLDEELSNVHADAIYTVLEGHGITDTIKLPAPAN